MYLRSAISWKAFSSLLKSKRSFLFISSQKNSIYLLDSTLSRFFIRSLYYLGVQVGFSYLTVLISFCFIDSFLAFEVRMGYSTLSEYLSGAGTATLVASAIFLLTFSLIESTIAVFLLDIR